MTDISKEAVGQMAGVMPRYFGVWSSTGVQIGVWEDGRIAGKVVGECPQHRKMIEMVSVEDAGKYAASLLAEVEAERDGYREAYEDTKRLARLIDVAMHGEADAARQASLCDLVGPAADLKARAEAAEAALPAVYRLALADAVKTLRTKRTHMYTTPYDEFVQTRTRGVDEMADMIEAAPTPTAADLMAQIKEGKG